VTRATVSLRAGNIPPAQAVGSMWLAHEPFVNTLLSTPVDRLVTDRDDGVAGVASPLEERAELLASIPLFRGLNAAQLQPLTEAAEVLSYQPGDRIVRQGDPGESVFLILDGRVEVLARVVQYDVVTETVVAWMTTGDALGELSLLDGQPRSATCVAVSPVRCLSLGREAFLTALRENWALSHALHVVLAQRIRMADKLLAEHSRDPLTGLNNRRALADLYERESQRVSRAARQYGTEGLNPLAVVFADVNRFKEINDTYGHHTGDEVLQAIASLLTTASRTTDLVARYGGDEFVILLPDAGVHGAELVMGRVRQYMTEDPPGPVPFTISLGYAIVDPEHPEGLEALLAAADLAMYRDKVANSSNARRSLTGLMAQKADLQ
jgi:diguanylate cyclase (GGDEF)-like protein